MTSHVVNVGLVLSLHVLPCGQEWGAECSSALFELPHFAVELLIVLPTVQIICSRLRILAQPQLRVVVCHLRPCRPRTIPAALCPVEIACKTSCSTADVMHEGIRMTPL
jgi:hypothetical protein